MTYESTAIAVKEPDLIGLHKDGKQIGRINVVNGKLVFEGDMEESAQLFAEEVVKIFNQLTEPVS